MNRRLRRLLRRLAPWLAGGVVLVLASPLLLNLPPLQRTLLARLNQRLEGRLSLERLNLTLWPLGLELDSLCVTDTGGRQLLRLDGLRLRLAPGELARRTLHVRELELVGPWLRLEDNGQGRPTLLAVFDGLLPAASPSGNTGSSRPWRITVDRLAVSRAGAELDHFAGLRRASLAGLDVQGSGRFHPGNHRLDLNLVMAGLELDPGPGPLVLDRLGLELALAGDSLQHLELRAAGSGLELELAARAAQPWPETRAHATGSIHLALDHPHLAPWLGPLSGGRLDGRVVLDGPLRDPDLGLDLTLAEPLGLPGRVDSLRARLELAGRQLALDTGVIQRGGGRLELSLAVDGRRALPEGLLGPRDAARLAAELQGRLQWVDLGPFLPALEGYFPGHRVSGRFELAARDWSRLQGALEAGLELARPGTRPEARLDLALELDSLAARLDHLVLALPGLGFEAGGTVLRADSSLALGSRWTLESAALPGAPALCVRDTGTLEGRLSLGGTLASPRLDLSAHHGGGRLAGVTLDSLALTLAASGNGLLLESALDLGSAGTLSLQGEARPTARNTAGRMLWTGTSPRWSCVVQTDSLDLAALPLDSLLTGRVQASLKADGRGLAPARLQGRAALELGSTSLGLPGFRRPVPLAARLDLQGTSKVLALETLDLGLAGARLSGSARLGRRDGRLEGAFDVTAPQLGALPLADSLAGDLAGHLELGGTSVALELDLDLSGHGLWTPWQPLGELEASLHHGPRLTVLERLRLEPAPGQGLTAHGRYGSDGQLELGLVSDTLALALFPLLPEALRGQGTVALELSARGRWPVPELAGSLAGRRLGYGDQALPDLRVEVSTEGDSLHLRARQFFELEGSLHRGTGGYAARFHIPVQDLEPYLALAGAQGLALHSGLDLDLSGQGRDPSSLQARLCIPELRLSAWEGPSLEGQNLRARWSAGRLTLEGVRLNTDGQGFLALTGSGRPDSLGFRLLGLLPLALAEPFSPALAGLEGRLKLSGVLAGSLAEPVPALDLELEQAALRLPVLEQRLHQVEGALRLRRQELVLERLSGGLDDGRFQASGRVGLSGLRPDSLDLRLTAQALELDLPGQAHLLAGLDLRARGDSLAGRVEGELTVLEGLYYGDLGLDPGRLAGLVGRRRESTTGRSASSLPPILAGLELDVGVSHRRPFVVENNLLSAELAPDLQVRGTLASPLPAGRARINNGQVRFAGREFEITRGIVDFVDPTRIDPELDIESTVVAGSAGPAGSQQWTITLAVDGTASAPRLRLSSLPVEEDEDVLSILLTGRRSADLGALGGSGDLSPQQVLGRLLLASAQESLQRASGLDLLAVELGSEDGSSADRLKLIVGKSLTRRLSTYWSLESSQGRLVRTSTAELRLRDELTLAAFQNSQQEIGGELKLKQEFR